MNLPVRIGSLVLLLPLSQAVRTSKIISSTTDLQFLKTCINQPFVRHLLAFSESTDSNILLESKFPRAHFDIRNFLVLRVISLLKGLSIQIIGGNSMFKSMLVVPLLQARTYHTVYLAYYLSRSRLMRCLRRSQIGGT